MKEIFIKNKPKYLEKHPPLFGVPKSIDKRLCTNCRKVIATGNYKVFVNVPGFPPEARVILCPDAPACNGTSNDWIPIKERNQFCYFCNQITEQYGEIIYNTEGKPLKLWICKSCDCIIESVEV